MAAAARILVVEDEGIVGMDICQSLADLGYLDPELASNGEEAVEMAQSMRPDLVLMDIRLGEGMDGIDAAMAIGDCHDAPIVYLTAYTDEPTLERAKLSQPFGYLVKPFHRKDLQTTIEVAMHKYFMEKQLRDRERWLDSTLRSLGKPVVTTRLDGRITFMNRQAEVLTGWTEADAFDTEVGRIIASGAEASIASLQPVVDSTAHISGARGQIEGLVMVLREVARRQQEELSGLSPGEGQGPDPMDSLVRMTRSIAQEFGHHLSVIHSMSELLAENLKDQPDRQGIIREIARACRDSEALTRRLRAIEIPPK